MKDDCMDWTPKQCLESALEKAEEHDYDSCFVILLDIKNNRYDWNHRCSGLTYSQLIALLDIVKQSAHNDFFEEREKNEY